MDRTINVNLKPFVWFFWCLVISIKIDEAKLMKILTYFVFRLVFYSKTSIYKNSLTRQLCWKVNSPKDSCFEKFVSYKDANIKGFGINETSRKRLFSLIMMYDKAENTNLAYYTVSVLIMD